MCYFLTAAVEANKLKMINYRAFDTLVAPVKHRELFETAEMQTGRCSASRGR